MQKRCWLKPHLRFISSYTHIHIFKSPNMVFIDLHGRRVMELSWQIHNQVSFQIRSLCNNFNNILLPIITHSSLTVCGPCRYSRLANHFRALTTVLGIARGGGLQLFYCRANTLFMFGLTIDPWTSSTTSSLRPFSLGPKCIKVNHAPLYRALIKTRSRHAGTHRKTGLWLILGSWPIILEKPLRSASIDMIINLLFVAEMCAKKTT